MKRVVRRLVPLAFTLFFLAPVALAQPAANAGFDFKNMSDMSDFDPANPVIPTGDTIKIAVVASFSGPAALVGQIYWTSAALGRARRQQARRNHGRRQEEAHSS
jgi:hypothetical protein